MGSSMSIATNTEYFHENEYSDSPDTPDIPKIEPSISYRNSIDFNAQFPSIKRIEIVGNWFNKKPRAIIEWNGVEFGRKMADFKWFWRMLSLNSSIERVVPEYPSDIPESLWPDGYLRRRKRELNLFLMQCHSLPWIKKYKLWHA